MEQFLKTAALVLLSVILILVVGKQEKDIAVLLTIACCCITTAAAVEYLRPVLDLAWELASLAELESECLGILLRIAGISFVTETGALICSDAGSSSMGKMLQLLGTGAMICMGIPLIQTLLILIQDIMGAI